jgi:hypothetical protein
MHPPAWPAGRSSARPFDLAGCRQPDQVEVRDEDVLNAGFGGFCLSLIVEAPSMKFRAVVGRYPRRVRAAEQDSVVPEALLCCTVWYLDFAHSSFMARTLAHMVLNRNPILTGDLKIER